MLINNAKKYFENSWQRRWTAIDLFEHQLFEKYEVNTDLLNKYIDVEDSIWPGDER